MRPIQSAPDSSQAKPSRPGGLSLDQEIMRFAWLFFYSLNLIVPGYFSLMVVVRPINRIGIVVAVILLAGLGRWALGRYRWWIGAAVTGAMLMALSQFFPFLQIQAGIWALSLILADPTARMGPQGLPIIGNAGSFVATVVTGLELLAVSLVAGGGLKAGWQRCQRLVIGTTLRYRSTKPTTPDPLDEIGS